jgi:hypothetical protein
MKKTRVKFLDSIAGLGDPKPVEVLDGEYAKVRAEFKARKPPMSDARIAEIIERRKAADRYGAAGMGFARDFSFKPDQEALIPAELARAWEEAGVCLVLPAAVAA